MMKTNQEITVESSEEPDLKKITERHDKKDNSDKGYMTSSNDSLYADVLMSENYNNDKQSKLNGLSDDQIIRILNEVNNEIGNIPEKQRREWLIEKFSKYFSSVMPTSLIELSAAHFFKGDCDTSINVKPDWLDIDKFRRGQKFALDQKFGIDYANLLALFIMFAFEDAHKPLIFTNASSTPYTAFKRYLSTSTRLQNWYSSDPWTVGTQAYNEIRTVRRMHAMVRKQIQEMSYDEYEKKTKIKDSCCPALSRTRLDMQSSCPISKSGQCPYMAFDNFPQMKEHKINQSEMAVTQFAFVGIHILNPKFFGMHGVTDEDLEAFVHMWRGLGYLLGIDDDFNFCRGTLEDVRTRSRDILEYWVKPNFRMVSPEWEHMARCVIESLQYYLPGSTYETCLLDLAVIMNLHLPRTYDSLSYSLWIKHNIIRFYFNYGSKLSGFRTLMNRRLNRALEKARNYDDRKHHELQERSKKTMDIYFTQKTCNEISREESLKWGFSIIGLAISICKRFIHSTIYVSSRKID